MQEISHGLLHQSLVFALLGLWHWRRRRRRRRRRLLYCAATTRARCDISARDTRTEFAIGQCVERVANGNGNGNGNANSGTQLFLMRDSVHANSIGRKVTPFNTHLSSDHPPIDQRPPKRPLPATSVVPSYATPSKADKLLIDKNQ